MSSPPSPEDDAKLAATPQPGRRVSRDQPPWPTPRRSEARSEAGSAAPAEPGSHAPAEPGSRAPAEPGSQARAEPGSEGHAEPAAGPPGGPVAAETGEQQAAAEVEMDLEVATVARQRDEYLESLRRLQADFENYRKRVERQRAEQVERAAGDLVAKLLPVCDTADLAIAHGGGEEVKQIWTALFDTLERQGLVRIDPVGDPFDPTLHDAVVHEPADGDSPPTVAEVLRAGYLWKGRVLRPAMVKVKG